MAPHPESSNFHERLGVDADASPDDINKAFRGLAKEHHPDVGGETETFQRILEAREILTSPEKNNLVPKQEEVVTPAEPETDTKLETDARIAEIKKELDETEVVQKPETKPVPPDGEPPQEEGGGGDGGGGRSWGSQEWGLEYQPCPTCYHKLRYIILRCPQCKGRGSIPKREWHRSTQG